MPGVGEVRLLVAVVVGCPTVGHQEVQDGGVVGDVGMGPAHHQSAAVHVLHLHVVGGAAAHCGTQEDRKCYLRLVFFMVLPCIPWISEVGT